MIQRLLCFEGLLSERQMKLKAIEIRDGINSSGISENTTVIEETKQIVF